MTDGATPVYRRILEANGKYAAAPGRRELASPAPRLAVITCMDARIDPLAALGLGLGEAHVIRNGGALATDDAIRSLVISQRRMGTSEVLVIGHTDCGMLGFADQDLRAELVRETGIDLDLPMLTFEDLAASVARQVEIVRAHPWTRDVPVHGLVYDVSTGRLEPVG